MVSYEKAAQRAAECFASGYNCAESVLIAATEHVAVKSTAVPRAATAFGGGIARMQLTCGALTGGVIAIGLFCGRDDPKGDRARSDGIAKEYATWFEARFGCADCRGLSGMDFSDPEQSAAFRAPGGKHQTICVPLVREAAAKLCRLLDAAR